MNTIKDDTITIEQWGKLSPEGKEKMKLWAMKNGFGLDTIPGPSGSFDPVCDYAALLSRPQMLEFIRQADASRAEQNAMSTASVLWHIVLDLVNE